MSTEFKRSKSLIESSVQLIRVAIVSIESELTKSVKKWLYMSQFTRAISRVDISLGDRDTNVELCANEVNTCAMHTVHYSIEVVWEIGNKSSYNSY
mgnify:CR=1 FL=1